MQPTYEELAGHYRKLLMAALVVNDSLRRGIDHAVFEGTTEQVDNLREAVNEHLDEWGDFIYIGTPTNGLRS